MGIQIYVCWKKLVVKRISTGTDLRKSLLVFFDREKTRVEDFNSWEEKSDR